MSEENVKTINFDGKVYKIENLTDIVKEGFNLLIKLQEDVQKYSYELQKTQAAQKEISAQIKTAISEDKILEESISEENE